MRSLNPFRTGFWLSWLTHDVSLPEDEKVPSRRSLRWNTKSVYKFQFDHFWSEISVGVAPCVESWLMQIDVKPWIGKPYTLWAVDISIQVVPYPLRPPVTFERNRVFSDKGTARREFERYREALRECLVGEKRWPPQKIEEIDSIA